MARGFNTTLGVDAADAVDTNLSSYPNTISGHVWSYRHGAGGSNAGRIFSQVNASSQGLNFFNLEASTVYQFAFSFDTTSGSWNTDTRPSADTWAACGFSYDSSSAANSPTVWLEGVKKTLGSGLTAATTAVGARIDATGFHLFIGNRTSDSARCWDGNLAEAAFWNAILTDGEFAALAKGYSPSLIRPQSLTMYCPLVRANVDYKGAAPTVNGTVVQPHPRVIYPKRKAS